jgi:hypothetical protein
MIPGFSNLVITVLGQVKSTSKLLIMLLLTNLPAGFGKVNASQNTIFLIG